jgi:Nif-specific regulatory protein
MSLEEAVSRFEKDMVIDALKSSRGNMRKAAAALETTERIFGYKVKKYGVNPKQYR